MEARLALDAAITRLKEEAQGGMGPSPRPSDAASLIVLDRSGPAPRVLMGKRNPNMRFMPNVFVFPGGRSEPGDTRVPVARELEAQSAALLLVQTPRGTVQRARRLALAAIRETFEETGLIIGHKAQNAPALPAPWDAFTKTGHVPDLAGLIYLSRAITPPRRPRRFDTRFFVVDAGAITHRIDPGLTAESELTELLWLTLDEAFSQPIHPITRVILADLAQSLAAGGPGHGRPVPFYREKNRQFTREIIAL